MFFQKIVRVTPVFKSCEVSDFGNYHPISVLYNSRKNYV